MLEFAKLTPAEESHVAKIVRRAVELYASLGYKRTPLDVRMDITAVHAKMPLLLGELSEADDANFGHDIGGINKYLDRTTGELTDCFVPRYAAPQHA